MNSVHCWNKIYPNIHTTRLTKEYAQLKKDMPKNVFAVPDPNDFHICHFLLYGIDDPLYSDGFYHGKLAFHHDYPLKAPHLTFVTPNGRFNTGESICLSFTNYHQESWNPCWRIENMLIAIISFMLTNEKTKGSMPKEDKSIKKLAKESLSFNLADETFVRVFEPYFEILGISSNSSSPKPKADMLLDESKTL